VVGDSVAVAVRVSFDASVCFEPAEVVGGLAGGHPGGSKAAELGSEGAQVVVGETGDLGAEGHRRMWCHRRPRDQYQSSRHVAGLEHVAPLSLMVGGCSPRPSNAIPTVSPAPVSSTVTYDNLADAGSGYADAAQPAADDTIPPLANRLAARLRSLLSAKEVQNCS